jgi:hypothetical protein
MPFMTWDPIDVLSLFDAMPVEDRDGLFHQYTLEQASLHLQLTIWQYDADVEIILRTADLPEPIARHTIQNCPEIRVVSEKAGKFMEFAAPLSIQGGYVGQSQFESGLRLWMDPQIRIETKHWRIDNP